MSNSISSTISDVVLAIWSAMPHADQPSVEWVQQSLARFGLSPEPAKPVPITTAFRRAVEAKADEGTAGSKDKKKASFRTIEGNLIGQLDRETNPVGTKRIVRDFLCSWELHVLSHQEGQPERWNIQGDQPLDLTEFKNFYAWGDVSLIVQNILKTRGIGAYSPRRSGGVYFVPIAQNSNLLQQLKQACALFNYNVFYYQMEDTEAQRAEISESIYGAVGGEIEIHRKAILEYSQETKRGVVVNRQEAMVETDGLIDRLQSFLRDRRYRDAKDSIGQLGAQVVEVLRAIDAYKPRSSVRRIVGVS